MWASIHTWPQEWYDILVTWPEFHRPLFARMDLIDHQQTNLWVVWLPLPPPPATTNSFLVSASPRFTCPLQIMFKTRCWTSRFWSSVSGHMYTHLQMRQEREWWRWRWWWGDTPVVPVIKILKLCGNDVCMSMSWGTSWDGLGWGAWWWGYVSLVRARLGA